MSGLFGRIRSCSVSGQPAGLVGLIRLASVLSLVSIVVAGCGQDPVSPPLSDGVLGTFVAKGDTFDVWITNAQARADVVAVWNGTGTKTIPSGKLNLGPGTLAYNQPWSWNIDQDDIQMVAAAADECNGTPSEVEADLDGWINGKGRFCPGDSKLIFLESL